MGKKNNQNRNRKIAKHEQTKEQQGGNDGLSKYFELVYYFSGFACCIGDVCRVCNYLSGMSWSLDTWVADQVRTMQ